MNLRSPILLSAIASLFLLGFNDQLFASNQVIVELDSRTYFHSGSKKSIELEPGEYELDLVKGKHTAWSAWGNGNRWLNSFVYGNEEIGYSTAKSSTRWSTPDLALANANTVRFSLKSLSIVYFYVPDAINVGWDNRGGLSLQIEKISHPLVSMDFEQETDENNYTVLKHGGYSVLPGIKDSASFGSSRAFSFGRSTCGASCFRDHVTSLEISLAAPAFVSSISFSEIELYGNWGSNGRVIVDGEPIANFNFGRSPYNDQASDSTPRKHDIAINKMVSSIILEVEDITTVSEILIDDIVISTPYVKSARQLFESGITQDGKYLIDPDGIGGEDPFTIDCLMSLSGGGWTKLNLDTATSLLNTDANTSREYLFVKKSTDNWYRTPVSNLEWDWFTGKDLYGTYYYSSDEGESTFEITPSSERQLYGIGGSSGGGKKNKCLIYYWDHHDPENATVEICQDKPGIFGAACAGPTTVFIRETSSVEGLTLKSSTSPENSGIVSGSGVYQEDAIISISATPASGYRFSHWEGDGIEDPNASATHVTVAESQTIIAQFVKTWHLQLQAYPIGSGQFDGQGLHDNGTLAHISAESLRGGQFIEWTGEGITDPSSPETTILMDQDKQAIARFSAPDLSVAQISGPSNAIANTLQRLSWTIENPGTASIDGAWIDRIWLSADETIGSDLLVSSHPIATTVSNQDPIHRIQNILIPPSLEGQYWIVVEVNANQGAPEMSYANNIAISSLPITIAPPPAPNLIVRSVSSGSELFEGQTVEIQWIVENSGNTDTGSTQWEETLYLSTDETWDRADVLLGSKGNTSALSPSEAYNNQLTVQLPKRIEGPFHFIVVADSRKQLEEGGREDDNHKASSAADIALSGWPDLQVASVTSPFDAFSGEALEISWSVRNASTRPTEETKWRDNFFISKSETPSNDMTLVGSFIHEGPLSPDESYSTTQTIVMPIGIEGSDYHLHVLTDAGESVWEHVFENNNFGSPSHSIEVHLTPPPDLEVETIDLPEQGCAGSEFLLSYTIANNGSNDTPNYSWFDNIYLSSDTVLDPNSDIRIGQYSRHGKLARDDSYQATLSLRIPITFFGQHYVIIVADGENTVFETDKDNNQKIGATPIEILPLSDLQVSEIQIEPSAYSGESSTISFTIVNQGPCETLATNWTDAVYISTDQTLDKETDIIIAQSQRNQALSNGESYQTQILASIPIGLHDEYYVFVASDLNDDVAESDNSNNSLQAIETLAISLPENDLEFVEATIPPTALAGRALELEAEISNNGSRAILNASWTDSYYLSKDQELSEDDIPLGDVEATGILNPNTSYHSGLSIRIPDSLSGIYYLIAHADSGEEVFEQNEANNIYVSNTPISIKSEPADLVVVCSAPEGTYIAGNEIRVEWTVLNAGIGSTTVNSWTDVAVLSSDTIFGNADDQVLAEFSHNGALGVEESYSQNNRAITIPSSSPKGVYTLFIQTDALDQVYEGEADMENDCTAATLTIERPDVDLAVSELERPDEGDSGKSIFLSWTVENRGNRPTRPNHWTDTAYLSRDRRLSDDDIELGAFKREEGLSPQTNYRKTEEVLLPPELEGNYYVLVKADGANAVPESTESNNDLVSEFPLFIHLSPAPNLLINNVAVPPNPVAGQAADFSWEVFNSGATTEQDWYDRIYLSFDQVFDPKDDIYLGYRQHLGGLEENISYEATQSFDLPKDLYGTLYVIVHSDSRNQVYKLGSENDNIGISQAFEIERRPLSDLVVTKISLPSETVQAGETIDLNFSVLNQSPNPIIGKWEDNLYLSKDDQWDPSDPLISQVIQDQFLGPWQSYSSNLAAQLPGATLGGFRIIAKSDALGRIPESDETNNTAASQEMGTLTLPTLQSGESQSNSIENSNPNYYYIDAPEGATLAITVTSSTDPEVAFPELYASFEDAPTRSKHDFAAIDPFSATQRIVIPQTQEGRYYILVQTEGADAVALDYELTAEFVEFTVFDTDYGKGGNVGNLTIEINGAKFDRSLTATLSNGTDVERLALNMYFTDTTKTYATLDLVDLTPGMYSLIFENDSGGYILIEEALEVVEGGGPNVTAQIDAPDVVGRNRWFSFTVGWSNDGLNDALAPLLQVDSTAPIYASPQESSLTERYQFLGTSTDESPGILRPNQGYFTNFYAYSDAADGDYIVSIRIVGIDPKKQFNWEFLRSEFISGKTHKIQLNQILDNIQNNLDYKWEAYLEMLSQNANIVTRATKEIPSRDDLIAYEMHRTQRQHNSQEIPISFESNSLNTTSQSIVSLSNRINKAYNYEPVPPRPLPSLPNMFKCEIVQYNGQIYFPNALAVDLLNLRLDLEEQEQFIRERARIAIRSTGNYRQSVITFQHSIQTTWRDELYGAIIPFSVYDYADAVGNGNLTQFIGTLYSDLILNGLGNGVSIPISWAMNINEFTERITQRMEGFIQETDLILRLQNTYDELIPEYEFEIDRYNNGDGNRSSGWLVGINLYNNINDACVEPAPPVAFHDEYTVRADRILRILEPGVLANDTDPNFHELIRVTNFERISFHGARVNMSGNGSFTYDPRSVSGFRNHPARSLTDVFTYTISDTAGGSDQTDVFISVINTDYGEQDDDSDGDGIPDSEEDADGDGDPDITDPDDDNDGDPDDTDPDDDGDGTPDCEEDNDSDGVGDCDDCDDDNDGKTDSNDPRCKSPCDDPNTPNDDCSEEPPCEDDPDTPENECEEDPPCEDDPDTPEDECAEPPSPEPPCTNCGGGGTEPIGRPGPIDPNDILGPDGYGAEKWIHADLPLSYKVRFENDPILATAPAQVITISVQLDEDFDPRSIRLGEFGIGNQTFADSQGMSFFQKRLDFVDTRGVFVDVIARINISSGELLWKFTSIDPATGTLPENPLIGLLPINLISPEGEGFVTYSVKAKDVTLSGARLDAMATIVFDHNEPIDTDPIWHTADKASPQSSVSPLPSEDFSPNFTVSWSGEDEPEGSGIATYDIYVKTDNDPCYGVFRQERICIICFYTF